MALPKNKKQWWAGLRAQHRAGKLNPRDIYVIYPGVRANHDFATCRKWVGQWLRAEPDAPTFPELIPAICLSEENSLRNKGTSAANTKFPSFNGGPTR